MQDLLEEGPETAHDALASHATAHVDVAVVSVAAEGEFSSFQLPVQVRQRTLDSSGESGPLSEYPRCAA